MHKILVSGLINLEVTLRVDGFPIDYDPVRFPFFGVGSSVSGVGYNVAKALNTLGTSANFLSLIGTDPAGALVSYALDKDHIDGRYIAANLRETPHSVILYDANGQRAINVDLKDIQERAYPHELFREALQGCTLAALCNINFSRTFLQPTRQAGVPIATDVHTISDLDDDYNRAFMQHADILFMSDESLPCAPEEWARRVQNHCGAEVIVIGLGREGALMAVRCDNFIERIPAVQTRPIVNSIGAGDALFSAFIHFYNQTPDPYTAIKKATVFASYKIGAKGAADGFLSEAALNKLYGETDGIIET